MEQEILRELQKLNDSMWQLMDMMREVIAKNPELKEIAEAYAPVPRFAPFNAKPSDLYCCHLHPASSEKRI